MKLSKIISPVNSLCISICCVGCGNADNTMSNITPADSSVISNNSPETTINEQVNTTTVEETTTSKTDAVTPKKPTYKYPSISENSLGLISDFESDLENKLCEILGRDEFNFYLESVDGPDVSAHPFCHSEGNVFCHADTRSVKVEALYFVRTPTCFVRAADAPGKTKAINPSCASAKVQKQKRYLSGYANREDTVFAFMKKHDIIEIFIPIERNTIAVLIVMTSTHDTAIVPNMIIVSRFFEYVKDGIHYITGTETVICPDCGQIMKPHSRCRRYIRRLNGMRDKLSVRVLLCTLCHRYHREDMALCNRA